MIWRFPAPTILTGVVAGVLAALAMGRVVRSLLFGVSGTDFASFGAVTLILLLTASLATWLPARRAARVAPSEALRVR